jgi:type II secretory pathway component PulK
VATAAVGVATVAVAVAVAVAVVVVRASIERLRAQGCIRRWGRVLHSTRWLA